jgi:thioredoxin-like negative regulator of GroEL
MTGRIFINRLLASALIAPLLGGCGNAVWNDYRSGIDRVQQERRRGLVTFTAGWSADSREMDSILVEPEVQKLLNHFVVIRVDAVIEKSIADQYGVQTVPSYVVIRPDLTIAGGAAGKMDSDRFRGFLIKHSFD